MTNKPKISLDQFKDRHLIPANVKNSIMGGTIVCMAREVNGGTEGDKNDKGEDI